MTTRGGAAGLVRFVAPPFFTTSELAG